MVDVDRRMSGLNPAHVAGLRRLSARASAPSTPTSLPLRNGLQSLSSLADKVITHLRDSGFQVQPGLLDAEPSDPEKALRVARNALKRAPLLIPIFNHCYIPCNPSLAGNPIFFIDETRVFCCGFDLSDFFERESLFRGSEPDPGSLKKQRSVSEKSAGSSTHFSRRSLDAGLVTGTRTPRWVEFWSDAAVDRRRRFSSSSSSNSSPERYLDMPRTKIPKWVDDYIDQIGCVLREGGWAECDVAEIRHVSASGFFEEEMVLLDNQAVLDALLLKVDRFSDSLRKAGWSSEEVSDALGFDYRLEKEKKPAKKLSPELVEKIGKLAESVTRS
ncbi:hypothetical protein Gotri_018855 [Gossypium trilobum]|uniref:Uncharacterized protein n=1 Tax=Gossypium trilobum TaxID=34281 RepID=A0A7J9EB18_9ROSI|nr:hypothetical protein [Gossypium trilobum]